MSSNENRPPSPTAGYVMEQSMRFSATLTCILLAATVTFAHFGTLRSPAVTLLTGFLWINFALGAFLSPKHTCAAFLFGRFLKTRIRNPRMEHVAAPRFAQLVGFVFLTFAVTGLVLNWPPLFLVGTAGAFTGAFINAAFNYCIACRLYRVFTHARKIPVLIADENA